MKAYVYPLLCLPMLAGAEPSGAPDAADAWLAQTSSRKATQRDNELALRYGDGVQDITLVYGGTHHVTDGQPLQAVQVVPGGDRVRLQVLAGRKRSPEVAATWHDQLYGEDRHMFGTSKQAATGHPDALNFWVSLDMFVNGVPIPEPVYIGQGSNFYGNNWWLGNMFAIVDDCRHEFRMRDVYGQLYCIRELGRHELEVSACPPL